MSSLNVSGESKLRLFLQDGTSGAAIARTFGRDLLPALDIGLDFGTGSGQANKLYIGKRTIAAATFDNIDLAGSLVDGLGNTLTFANLKLALAAIVTPDGTKSLRVGPQGVANAFQGPWGGTAAAVYRTFKNWDLAVYEPVTGFPVTAGTGDIFPVYNPGATSLDFWLLLAGT